jgi:diaminopimelate decarboxylase
VYIFENGEWQMQTAEGQRPIAKFTEGRSRAFYLYDMDDAVARAKAFAKHPARTHFAMKANSHARLLRTFQSLGLGVDVVSLGEMQKALSCGFAPDKIIFSGVGKDREELEAALQHEILQINVESFEELQHLEVLARERGAKMDVALRLNIHIAAPTHKNIQTATKESKFGLDQRQLPEVLAWLKNKTSVRLKSLTVHIGSQILDLSVFEKMAVEMGKIFKGVREQGFPLERIDLGGGLGIDYKSDGREDLQRLEEYVSVLLKSHGTGAEVILEPGRFMVARMGVLLAKVIYVKKTLDRRFLILNAGMNALMRPALYQAYHRIEPVKQKSTEKETYSIVGPICESTDMFAEQREIPKAERGDWMAIFDAGAYGAVMANTYNESALPEEWSMLGGVLEVS